MQENQNIQIIEKEGKMLVPGVVFASQKLFEKISQDKTLEQVKNVACLPGIVEKSIAMPDAHQGYGFPVGGVAAFDLKKGIISPGGIGYDINCGVRLLLSKRTRDEAAPPAKDLGRTIFAEVPSGVGRGGSLKLTQKKFNQVLLRGTEYMREEVYATDEDLARTESGGRLLDADPEL